MRRIAFITCSADILKIPGHIRVNPEAPRNIPVRGPPLCDDWGAQESGEGVDSESDWDMAAQPAPNTVKTSAPFREPAKDGERRAGVALCAWAARRAVCDDGTQILRRSGQRRRGNTLFEAALLTDAWLHAVEFPIRHRRVFCDA